MCKHVLIITLHADPITAPGTGIGGGTHMYINELCTHLMQENWTVSIVTRKADEALPSIDHLSDSVKLFRIPIGKEGYLDKTELNKYHLQTIDQVENILNSLDSIPSLIHSIYWNSGRVAKDLGNKYNLPYVHTVISNGKRILEESKKNNMNERVSVESEVYRSASHIITISEQEKHDLVYLYGIEQEKISIVGRPVNNSFLNPDHDEMGMPIKLKYMR